jgi:hypothetical protein
MALLLQGGRGAICDVMSFMTGADVEEACTAKINSPKYFILGLRPDRV